MKKSWGIMIKKSDSTEHKDEALLLTVVRLLEIYTIITQFIIILY